MPNPIFTNVLDLWLVNISYPYPQVNDQTVLFQTIQSSMSTKLNGSKYCYVSLTVQLNISHLFKNVLSSHYILKHKSYTVFRKKTDMFTKKKVCSEYKFILVETKS